MSKYINEIAEGVRKGLVSAFIPEIKELRKDMNERFMSMQQEMDKRFDRVDERFEKMDKRFEKVDARFEKMDARFEKMDARFEKMDERFELMDKRFVRMDEKFDTLIKVIITMQEDISDIKGYVKREPWVIHRFKVIEKDISQIKQRLAA